MKNRKIKQIIVIGLVLVAIGLIFATYTLLSRIGKVEVVTQIAPADAKAIIVNQNGQETRLATSPANFIEPGRYKIKVEREGFNTDETEIEITEGKNDPILSQLNPETNEARTYLEDHADEFYAVQEVAGDIATDEAEGKLTGPSNQILSVLPYKDPYYMISYETNSDDTAFKITVATPSPRWRYMAIEKIREMGYNPSDYDIVFTDFSSPLQKGSGGE